MPLLCHLILAIAHSLCPNGERTNGEYPGWDAFGRVISHRWVDHTFGPGANSSVPNRTSIVDLSYEYDKAGNVPKRYDDPPCAKTLTESLQGDFRGFMQLLGSNA